jgi:hypothetical protein
MAAPVNCLIMPAGIDITPVDGNNPDTAFRCLILYTATVLGSDGMINLYAPGGVVQSVYYTGSIVAEATENAATLQTKITADIRSVLGLPLLPVTFLFDRKGAL